MRKEIVKGIVLFLAGVALLYPREVSARRIKDMYTIAPFFISGKVPPNTLFLKAKDYYQQGNYVAAYNIIIKALHIMKNRSIEGTLNLEIVLEILTVVKAKLDLFEEYSIDKIINLFQRNVNQPNYKNLWRELQDIEIPLEIPPEYVNLASYNSYPQNPRHLIIHAGHFFDQEVYAKGSIEDIMGYVGLGSGKNMEIYGAGGWIGSNHYPPSYLEHSELKMERDEDKPILETFIADGEEFILTGGAYQACHETWFTEVVRRKVAQGQRVIFHFPLDAIYPAAKYTLGYENGNNKYTFTLKLPWARGILNLNEALNKARIMGIDVGDFIITTDEISAAVFYNGKRVWANSNYPQVVINFWDSYQDWP